MISIIEGPAGRCLPHTAGAGLARPQGTERAEKSPEETDGLSKAKGHGRGHLGGQWQSQAPGRWQSHPRHAGVMHTGHHGEAQTTARDGIIAVPSAALAVKPRGLQPVPPSSAQGAVKGESPHLQRVPPAQTSGVQVLGGREDFQTPFTYSPLLQVL